MKKLFYLMVIVVVFVSCKTTQPAVAKENSIPASGLEANKKSDLIPFQQSYITKSESVINYSDEDVLGIDFHINSGMKFTSQLFSDNYEVRDGIVYVINSDLDKLKELPARSIWRVSSVDRIKKTGSQITGLFLTLDLKDKGIKYYFWFSRQSDGTFNLSERSSGWIEYKGKKYDAYVSGQGKVLYKIID